MKATAENVNIGTVIRYHDPEAGAEFTGVVIDVNYGAMRVQWDDRRIAVAVSLGRSQCRGHLLMPRTMTAEREAQIREQAQSFHEHITPRLSFGFELIRELDAERAVSAELLKACRLAAKAEDNKCRNGYPWSEVVETACESAIAAAELSL